MQTSAGAVFVDVVAIATQSTARCSRRSSNVIIAPALTTAFYN